jgi:hypothetical protein
MEEEEDWKADSDEENEEEYEITRPRYVRKRTLVAKKRTYNYVNSEDSSSYSDEDPLSDEDSLRSDDSSDEAHLNISNDDPFEQEIRLKFNDLCDEIEKAFQKENLVCMKCINVLNDF